jgi:hypothetical protein
MITVRIYTANMRKVIEEPNQGAYLRDTVITLQPDAFERLGNGVYYLVVIGQNGNERAVSKVVALVVLR